MVERPAPGGGMNGGTEKKKRYSQLLILSGRSQMDSFRDREVESSEDADGWGFNEIPVNGLVFVFRFLREVALWGSEFGVQVHG